MDIRNLLILERTLALEIADSKKRVFEMLSGLIADSLPSVSDLDVFRLLNEREKLGPTTIGKGVALPHARTKLIDKPVGAMLQLKKGIEIDSIDKAPVDLFFAFLIPENTNNDHLEILAQLAEIFSDTALRESLRHVKNNEELYERLTDYHAS